MYSLSRHTVQVNGWISLTLNLDAMSHSLDRLGYVADLIEQTVRYSTGVVKPDVVLTSRVSNRSIAVDCKSHRLTSDQTERYLDLESDPGALLDYLSDTTNVDEAEYAVETCYSSFADLARKDPISDYQFTFVQFEHTSSGVLIRNPISFDDTELADLFPINMDRDEALPTEYYPFDIEHQADYEEFVSAFIQSLIYKAANESVFEVEAALADAHPYWDRIGDEKQSRFIERGNILMRHLEMSEVAKYIEKAADGSNEYVIHHRTASALQKRIQDPSFIPKLAQEVFEQTTLDE